MKYTTIILGAITLLFLFTGCANPPLVKQELQLENILKGQVIHIAGTSKYPPSNEKQKVESNCNT